MTVYLVNFLPKIRYIHRIYIYIYMVLANPVYTGTGMLFSRIVMGFNLTCAGAGAAAQGQAAKLNVYTGTGMLFSRIVMVVK